MPESIRYINVGLVGHVSNGKTTLVKSLTNVDTKRDSREKAKNCTIRLGYANGILWECKDCDSVFCTDQEVTNKICEDCNIQLQPSVHISFTDMPGHHAYVSTMIRGASLIDCALVVTDARKSELQVQTLEHLAILEMLGVTNSLVIQNKVDLIKKQECLNHYIMLQNELKHTIAEKAPVIPISAQSEILIDVVIKHLLKMCRKVESDLKQEPSDLHGFTIVRSFDVNKPNTGIDRIIGGVVGGSVIGNEEYTVGDDVEIRPGLIHLDGTFMPLKTNIVGIRSEKKSVQSIARGGLFALGTKLDPAATRADRLVGCLVGRPEQLPEVVNELSLKVFYMKRTVLGDKVKKMSVGYTVKLVIGNTVVMAICSFSDKKGKMVTFDLQKPICIYMKKCLVYTAGKDSQLIAYSDITDKTYKK